ncbi:bark storage protein A-like isoform X2 [Neltuma alba]|uniref:bark storage protein A-like isoform X2 n=1 Tax=Neltuma alba TaxID=207710 RepID=UPI0010A513C9|nr:bark storage protein A-like isoform X2 [Prosopis alba]
MKMEANTRVLRKFLEAVMCVIAFQHVRGALTPDLLSKIAEANRRGPHIGRRFRFGAICEQPVIVVMTGLSMINAAVTTQLLLSFFRVKGVLHYGTAGNVNPSLNTGDVLIPQYWAHLALWSWQRYGQGPEDELPLEANGDYTREIGYLKFADYTTYIGDGSSYDNRLNNIWYQPEEIFAIDGTPEERQHAFWIPVDSMFFQMSQKLEELRLEKCFNSTCLLRRPKVARVQRGGSASIFLSNTAYRSFIYNKFNVSPIDMESASVALICLQQRVPFIAFRAVSGSKFMPLASMNSVAVVVEFIKQWAQLRVRYSL